MPDQLGVVMLRMISLFGSAAAWVIQMSLIESIAAYACYPHQVPLSAPLWVSLQTILIAISLLSLAAGLISGYIAWALARQLNNRLQIAATSGASTLNGGQDRFLALLGQLSSSIFIIAILFASCAVLLVSPCSAWI